jgi:cytochrome b561
MNWRNTTERYGSMSIGLHWLMLLLLAAVYAAMELRGIFPKGSDARSAMKTWHYMLGLSVLILALIRLVVNLTSPSPGITPDPPRGQKIVAKLMHLALYALIIVLPIFGWLTLSAEGDPIPFFGLHLPALLGQSESLEHTLKEIHETGATIGYYLIGLHAAAALFHHYFVRDNTLLRMLPGRK